jgi:hypothetical protein
MLKYYFFKLTHPEHKFFKSSCQCTEQEMSNNQTLVKAIKILNEKSNKAMKN